MSKLANQEIELFRAGTYPQGEFTEADLDRMVEKFQSGDHDVPFVVGHPESAAPAYGWLASMKRVGKLLVGTAKQVDPTFEEMVEAGRFKKRSVELTKRGDGWAVTHVGWLGAQAPAVKGLADCKFQQEGAEARLFFEEDLMAVQTEKTVPEQIKAFFTETFGGKPQTETFSRADVESIAATAVAAAVAPLKTQLAAATATFAERDQALASAETAARADAAVAKLKHAGKWVPAFDRQGLPLVFAELAKSGETLTFGEGDAKRTASPLDTLVQFMESLPKIVPSGEVYTGQAAATGAKREYKTGGRVGLDENSVRFDEAIQAYAKEHKVEYAAASREVARLHPELTVPGGASAGSV